MNVTAPIRAALLALTVTSPVWGQGSAQPSLAPSRGLAELPRALPPLPRALMSKPCSRTVRDGGDVQDALDKAKGGDVVCLARGGRYQGNLTLRARPDTGWIVVRTDVRESDVAEAGSRVRPSRSEPLAKILARSNDQAGSAVRTAPGARRWYLALLEITTDSTERRGPTALITLGGRDASEDPRPPEELVFDRVYAHGWPDQVLRRCFALNSGATAIVDSWIDECHEKGADSQAIAGWGGRGPYLIENNTLAGGGENVMFGGSDPNTPGLSPSDVVLRRNHIVTPIAWQGRWTKKNLLETKNVRRYLVENNVLEGSWADGQDGWAIILKSANQGGRCTWCITADVVIRRNLIRNVGAGININGRGGDRMNLDSLSRRIEITENYVEEVATMPYRGVGRLLMILSGVDGLMISQNTFLAPPTSTLTAALILGSPRNVTARELVFERNVMTRGKYGVVGCGGPKNMMDCLPGARFGGNILISDGGRPGERFLTGFSSAPTAASALGRAGVSRAEIERATAGVVVPR